MLGSVERETAEAWHVRIGERAETAQVAVVEADEDAALGTRIVVQSARELIDEGVAVRRRDEVLDRILSVRIGPVPGHACAGRFLPVQRDPVVRERRCCERVDHRCREVGKIASALCGSRD